MVKLTTRFDNKITIFAVKFIACVSVTSPWFLFWFQFYYAYGQVEHVIPAILSRLFFQLKFTVNIVFLVQLDALLDARVPPY